MDIFATDGSFSVALGGLDSFLYGWNKDKTLSVCKNPKSKYKHSLVSIQTNHGDFIEATDEAGGVVWQGGDGEWCHVPIGKKPIKLRFRRLPKPTLSKRDMEKARQKVKRLLVSDSPYSLGVPDSLEKAIAWMKAKLAEVPKAARKTAKIDFHSRSSYGESYDNIAITYTEPETDDELVWRLTVEAERGRVNLARKKQKLASLKAELESSANGQS